MLDALSPHVQIVSGEIAERRVSSWRNARDREETRGVAVSSRIFISYRRDDASAYAGRLYDRLSARFGDSQVFMDVDAIEPGIDFVQLIEESVDAADVLIAVIGRSWATAVDDEGHRRLDEPDDFVRLEVAAALRRKIRVIPVLVGGAAMPAADELPPDLAGLARRNGLAITDLDWRSGTDRLVETVERVLAVAREPREPREPPPEPIPRVHEPDSARSLPAVTVPLALGGAGLLTVGLFMRWSQGHSFLQNDFGGNAPHGGVFTSLAPIGVVVAAVLGAVLARNPSNRRLGAGALLGAGIVGTAKYLGVLQALSEASTGVTIGILGALAGNALVIAAAVLTFRATAPIEGVRDIRAACLCVAGAVTMIIATAVPFNGGGTALPAQKVARTFEEAFDPIVSSIAIIVIAALLLRPWRTRELSATVLTIAILNALLWVRYIGIPLIENSTIASFAAGGVVGLVGSGIAMLGALRQLQAPDPSLVRAPAVQS
jgi:TIR domain